MIIILLTTYIYSAFTMYSQDEAINTMSKTLFWHYVKINGASSKIFGDIRVWRSLTVWLDFKISIAPV